MTAQVSLKSLRDEAMALSRAIPDVMRSFQSVMKAAGANGAIDSKTKELMAAAISIAMRCEGCVLFHVHNAKRHGATREEIAETIGVAIEMGGGPATVYGGKALAAYDALTAAS
jgi:AhpD family alkylhydroperoxidase